MIYSTSRCPHCNNIVSKQTNPVKEIANPFEKCPFCGRVYKNSYKEEWITKSPLKRFLFFIPGYVWARAFTIPLLICALFLESIETSVIVSIWICGFIVWLTLAWFIYRNKFQKIIQKSLERTKDKGYLEILIKAGYKIYPIENSLQNNESNYTEKIEKQENIVDEEFINKEKLSIISYNYKFCFNGLKQAFFYFGKNFAENFTDENFVRKIMCTAIDYCEQNFGAGFKERYENLNLELFIHTNDELIGYAFKLDDAKRECDCNYVAMIISKGKLKYYTNEFYKTDNSFGLCINFDGGRMSLKQKPKTYEEFKNNILELEQR